MYLYLKTSLWNIWFEIWILETSSSSSVKYLKIAYFQIHILYHLRGQGGCCCEDAEWIECPAPAVLDHVLVDRVLDVGEEWFTWLMRNMEVAADKPDSDKVEERPVHRSGRVEVLVYQRQLHLYCEYCDDTAERWRIWKNWQLLTREILKCKDFIFWTTLTAEVSENFKEKRFQGNWTSD